MRQRADLFDHVVAPDHVAIEISGQLFIGDWPIVFLVAKTLRVEANQLGAIRDVVNSIPLNQRGRSDALIRPVVNPARRQFVVDHLPHELAV